MATELWIRGLEVQHRMRRQRGPRDPPSPPLRRPPPPSPPLRRLPPPSRSDSNPSSRGRSDPIRSRAPPSCTTTTSWTSGSPAAWAGCYARPSPPPAPPSSRRRRPCGARTPTPSMWPTKSPSATRPTSAPSASSWWTRTRRRRLRCSGARSTPATAWMLHRPRLTPVQTEAASLVAYCLVTSWIRSSTHWGLY